jgi:hypothetical protein
MQDHMQQNTGANREYTQQPQTPPADKKPKGDYIDFEEIN